MTKSQKTATLLIVPLAALPVWALAYGLILQFGFHDGRVLAQMLKENPAAPFLQIWTYSGDAILREVATLALAPALLVSAALLLAMTRREILPFGDAKFQTAPSLRQAGWFGKHGVYFGKFKGKFLRIQDDRHHMIIGPTRSGKGAGYVIPNALAYKGSMIVNDLKGEIFHLTAGYRAKTGNRVFLFSPGSERSHRYNPLDFIRPGTGDRTTDIQNIAQIMIPKIEGDNAVWQGLAQQVLAGVISYIHESDRYKDRRNLPEVTSFFANGEDLQELMQKRIDAEPWLSKFTIESFNRYIALNEKAARSALIEIDNALRPFQNEKIAAATLVTDLDIASIKRRPTTIYLAPNVNDVELLRPLLVLFIQQTLDLITRAHDEKSLPILFLLDEFRQLKKMTEITSKLPYVAGYNVKFAFVIQDLKNLDEIYGETTRHSMLGNCGYQLVLGANDSATAKYVSEALGKTTMTYWTESRSVQIIGLSNRSRLQQKRERDLLMPQEVRQLPTDDMILLAEGQGAIRGKKVRYFREKPFKAWSDHAAKNVPVIPVLEIPFDMSNPMRKNDEKVGSKAPISEEALQAAVSSASNALASSNFIDPEKLTII